MTNTLNGYIAGFNGKTIEIHAESLYAAKVQALAEFKPSKAKAIMVWVELAELGSKQVTSAITN